MQARIPAKVPFFATRNHPFHTAAARTAIKQTDSMYADVSLGIRNVSTTGTSIHRTAFPSARYPCPRYAYSTAA